MREDQQHGDIIGYTVKFKKLMDVDAPYKKTVVTSKFAELKKLEKYTVYQIEVLATTRVGNGPPSKPIERRTDEDSE